MQFADLAVGDDLAVATDDSASIPGRSVPTELSLRGASGRTPEIPGEHSVMPNAFNKRKTEFLLHPRLEFEVERRARDDINRSAPRSSFGRPAICLYSSSRW